MSLRLSSLITSSTINQNARKLNWESTKDKAIDAYQDVKHLVQRNIIMSIIITVVVLCLLLLCCYLRRKYARNAQVMSRRQHARLKSQRSKRREDNEKNRLKNRNVRKGSKRKMSSAQEEANLVNSSFETKATILSDTNEKFGDIENDGVELKLDDVERKPISGNGDGDKPSKGSRFKNMFSRKK